MYACLVGLPISKLPVAAITSTIVAYFNHDTPVVRLSARNVAQLLIPVADQSQKHFFFLSSTDVAAFLNASGKDMPASSLLKMLHMYGQIPRNNELFLQQGVFYYAYTVLFQSARATEKRLAFLVILMLSSSYQKPEKSVQDETLQENSAISTQDTTHNTLTAQTTRRSLTDIVTELSEQAQLFMTALNQECGKAIFESFRASLKDLEREYVSCNLQLHEASISGNISIALLDAIIVLLEGICTSH